jgi:hypothetical protein
MSRPYQPDAAELAMLTVILIQRYAKERGKDVSRFRLARNSLRRLAIRDRLRDTFVEEWADVMALEYNWLVFMHADEFLLLRAETTQTWTKVATKRCDDLIKRLHRGEGKAIDDAESEIDPIPDAEEGDEE